MGERLVAMEDGPRSPFTEIRERGKGPDDDRLCGNCKVGVLAIFSGWATNEQGQLLDEAGGVIKQDKEGRFSAKPAHRVELRCSSCGKPAPADHPEQQKLAAQLKEAAEKKRAAEAQRAQAPAPQPAPPLYEQVNPHLALFEALKRIDAKVDELAKQVGELGVRLASLEAEVDHRVDGVAAIVGEQGAQLDAQRPRLDNLANELGGLVARVERVEQVKGKR